MRQMRLNFVCLFWEANAVNKIVVLLMMCVLGWANQGVSAQELFGSQTLGELAPQTEFPTETLPSGSSFMEIPVPPAADAPLQEPLSLPSTTVVPGEQAPVIREMQYFDCDPALLESSGTWLRRGFWFAEADAVLFQRSWDRESVVLMVGGLPSNILSINDSGPGAEGAPRLKVGRFLFRDDFNRDHTLEFVAFGGGNWSQEQRLDGDNLLVPLRLRGTNNASFNGANTSVYTYDSWFNSFELDYHVKQRMLKDRMELEPNGNWVRRAQPSKTLSLLAGLRYLGLNEQIDWQAFGITDSTGDADVDEENGIYNIETENHLIGTQIGASVTYETARWSIGGQLKGGMYLNMMDVDSFFDLDTNSGVGPDGLTNLEEDNLSWLGEAALICKYHIRPNFSLRVGLEIMHLASVALAPHHIDFIPSGTPLIARNGEAVYMGGSIGFESYW